MNALSEFIPPGERVITIEDAAELQLNHIENLVRMETREANAEGAGAIGIGELIRAALRMRPDRLIIGEVRGKEALDLLQSLNTGHDGGFSSGHANSVKDMLSRLETMVLMAADLPLAADPEPDRVGGGHYGPCVKNAGQDEKSNGDRGGGQI